MIGSRIIGNSGAFYSESSRALDLNGTDEYAKLGDVSEIKSVSEFAISIWMKATWSSISPAKILDKEFNSSNRINPLTFNASPDLRIIFSGSNRSSFWHSPSDDTWYHYLISYDGSESTSADRVKIYVDSVSQSMTETGTVPATTANNARDLTIGAQHNGTSPFAGIIGDVAIYSAHKHTQSEADDIYNSGDYIDPRTLDSGFGLVAYFRPQDSLGESSWIDALGNYSSGTLSNITDADIVVDSPF